MASISASISSLLRSSPSKSRPRRPLTIATLLPPLQASTRDPHYHYHYPKAVASVAAAAPCPRPSAGELGLEMSKETAVTGGGGGKGGCGPRGGGGNGGGGNANWGQGGTGMDLGTLVFLIHEMARIAWNAAVHTPQPEVVSVCSDLETAICFFLLLTLAGVIIIVAAPAIALVNFLLGCLEAPRKLLEYVTMLMHGEGKVELCNAN